MAATFAATGNQIAVLKELYKDDKEFLKDLVYKKNPLLALIPKDEAADAFGGKYLPVPIQFGVPQGRSHNFLNAQGNQTPTQNDSFFVAVIEDYQLVTLTNLFMEQTKSNAGAFVDGVKHEMDGGFRNITNNVAFELFNDGSGVRGFIGAGSALISGTTYNIILSNPQAVVQIEEGMTLINETVGLSASGLTIISISALSTTTGVVQSVNRAAGTFTILASATDASWTTVGNGLSVQGDTIAFGAPVFNFGGSNTMLGLCGLKAWLPYDAPVTGDSFWGVDRSLDPTRLGGLRYNASQYTIEEGLINALAFADREGASVDLIIMDFQSYSSLVNQLGAKVMYTRAEHDEVEVGFDGILFQTNQGAVTVLADRSCPAQTAYCLTTDTWKLRSLGRVPKILTYGMEGLEGLRVGNADALEIRIAYYGNLTCSAPGWNLVVQLSS